MAGSLPNVRGSAQALYPVTRRVEFLTDVAIATNATEQRFKQRPPLTRFVLPYSRLSGTDVASLKSFFESQKGTFDSTWSFTLGGATYSNLTLEDAVYQVTENQGTQTYYDVTLRARQTKNAGQTAGSAGGTFPTLSVGARAQLPYVRMHRYAVLLCDNQVAGMRYAWTWFGGGLSGFPTGSLHGWTLTYPTLSDADLATLETFYRNQWGRWATWSFVDPDNATTYSNCRFDDDAFAVQHIGYNQSSVTLKILETN